MLALLTDALTTANFEHNPEIAAMLWHINSGTDRFSQVDTLELLDSTDPNHNSVKQSLLQDIKHQAVSFQEKHNLATKFYQAQGHGGYGNSFHECYNRAITVHGCTYAVIEDNVAYNIMGHTYFIEDGNELKNVMRHTFYQYHI